jgi:hypothetical protein
MARSLGMLAREVELAGCFLLVGGVAASSRAQNCNGAGAALSAVAVGGLAVFDIATAPESARRYNQRQLAISPFVNTRDRSYGVSVAWFYRQSRPALSYPARRAPAGARDSVRSHRSPGAAFALSFGSTVAPMAAGVGAGGNGPGIAMFLTGLVVGPSVGQLYAGRVGRGLGTMALRGLGTVAGIASLAHCWID